jgi:hypothetical protein
MSSLQTYKGYLTGSYLIYNSKQKLFCVPLPYIAVLKKVRYALCPMPYALCPMHVAYLMLLRKAIVKLNYLFSLVDFLGTIWL